MIRSFVEDTLELVGLSLVVGFVGLLARGLGAA
jgi:hypothetical protein